MGKDPEWVGGGREGRGLPRRGPEGHLGQGRSLPGGGEVRPAQGTGWGWGEDEAGGRWVRGVQGWACLGAIGCRRRTDSVCAHQSRPFPRPLLPEGRREEASVGEGAGALEGNAGEMARKRRRLHPIPGILEGPSAQLGARGLRPGCPASRWRPRPSLPRQRPASSGRCTSGRAGGRQTKARRGLREEKGRRVPPASR